MNFKLSIAELLPVGMFGQIAILILFACLIVGNPVRSSTILAGPVVQFEDDEPTDELFELRDFIVEFRNSDLKTRHLVVLEKKLLALEKRINAPDRFSITWAYLSNIYLHLAEFPQSKAAFKKSLELAAQAESPLDRCKLYMIAAYAGTNGHVSKNNWSIYLYGILLPFDDLYEQISREIKILIELEMDNIARSEMTGLLIQWELSFCDPDEKRVPN